MHTITLTILWSTVWTIVGQNSADPGQRTGATSERRAIAYLAREVPRWSMENRCFSCHNNGDAARALYTAVELAYEVPRRALADTSIWLARPDQWRHNGPDVEFSDKRLARIQFAAALVAAVEAGLVPDRRAIQQAATLLAADQQPDGSWRVAASGMVGSPATYGPSLATYLACRTLQKADAQRFGSAIARSHSWLKQLHVRTVLDAAAVLLALQDQNRPKAPAQQQLCLELIANGQAPAGGWGPYVNSPPEPFDTAVVLLAIAPRAGQAKYKTMLQRGRSYLIAQQNPDGGWTETTRPPGSESYAQHMSTSGWATLALLRTRTTGGTGASSDR